MNELYQLLAQIQAWHWLCLAIILISTDALLTGGFFLGVAAAAVVMWLIKALFSGMDWQTQLAIFAILSLIFSVLYNKLFKSFNEKSDVQNINNRAAQMVGKQITLNVDVPQGQSKIQIGDTFWKINSPQEFNSGEKVKISGFEGMELFISNVDFQEKNT